MTSAWVWAPQNLTLFLNLKNRSFEYAVSMSFLISVTTVDCAALPNKVRAIGKGEMASDQCIV